VIDCCLTPNEHLLAIS